MADISLQNISFIVPSQKHLQIDIIEIDSGWLISYDSIPTTHVEKDVNKLFDSIHNTLQSVFGTTQKNTRKA